MKLISWNVNGLRACMSKGFEDVFWTLDADVFCLQETKLQEGQTDFAPAGYRAFWNYAEKKGYSGTAIFTKHQPLNVEYGIGIDVHDHEGRVITLEMEQFYATAKDADIIIYNSTIDGELESLDELLSKSAILQDFKAVREGNVWCTGKNLYQDTTQLGTMIADMHTVFTEGDDPSLTELQFLYRLQ